MRKIRRTVTEADDEVALARAAVPMDCEEGTPEAVELNVLATLIEAYEDKHYRTAPLDPIEAKRA